MNQSGTTVFSADADWILANMKVKGLFHSMMYTTLREEDEEEEEEQEEGITIMSTVHY